MLTEAEEKSYKSALIRFWRAGKPIGAGVLLEAGYVLTCAHVVTAALDKAKAQNPVGETVEVDFPFVEAGVKISAQVFLLRPGGEDVAGLKLLMPAPPGAVPLRLLPPAYYRGHNFIVYGFPEGNENGGEARGELLGERPNHWIQIEDTKVPGYKVEPGFSGAPVWDSVLGGIVGLTVARDKLREASTVAFIIPARSLLPAQQAIENASLQGILADPGVDATSLEEAYYTCLPEGWTEATPDSLGETLVSLQTMPQGAMDYPALLQFVALLSLEALALPESVRQALLQWVTSRVEPVEPLLSAVADRRQARRAPQQEQSCSHLLFWVIESSVGLEVKEGLYIPDYEQYNPITGFGSYALKAPEAFARPLDRADLPKVLRACVEEACDRNPPHALTLELLLPLSLLNEAADAWEADDPDTSFLLSEPVGSRFRVVVRSCERLEKTCRPLQKAWEDKWATLRKSARQQACQRLVEGTVHSPRDLLVQLRQAQVVGMTFRVAPQTTDFGRNGRLSAFLGSAAPTAVWLRRQTSTIDCCAALETLLTCPLCGLPEAVMQARLEALPDETQEAHIGHHLALVWEDPKLMPPSARKTLQMP